MEHLCLKHTLRSRISLPMSSNMGIWLYKHILRNLQHRILSLVLRHKFLLDRLYSPHRICLQDFYKGLSMSYRLAGLK